MHVLLTDSGVGGLSVCAYAERLVRTRGAAEPVRLTFVNAAPANDHGYNSMPTRDAQREAFARFLEIATARYAPDLIYVACNTLSVLLPSLAPPAPTRGIVETAAGELARELERDPASTAIVFATPTTIASGTYPRLLEERGIAPARIVGQACPGLADTISEDRDGARSSIAIASWVAAALARRPDPAAPVVAGLACTHYGYRRELFVRAFADAGVRATVVDPNQRAADELFAPGAHREAEVACVARYRIPETAIDALSWFLGDISPATVTALQGAEHLPDLF